MYEPLTIIIGTILSIMLVLSVFIFVKSDTDKIGIFAIMLLLSQIAQLIFG